MSSIIGKRRIWQIHLSTLVALALMFSILAGKSVRWEKDSILVVLGWPIAIAGWSLEYKCIYLRNMYESEKSFSSIEQSDVLEWLLKFLLPELVIWAILAGGAVAVSQLASATHRAQAFRWAAATWRKSSWSTWLGILAIVAVSLNANFERQIRILPLREWNEDRRCCKESDYLFAVRGWPWAATVSQVAPRPEFSVTRAVCSGLEYECGEIYFLPVFGNLLVLVMLLAGAYIVSERCIAWWNRPWAKASIGRPPEG